MPNTRIPKRIVKLICRFLLLKRYSKLFPRGLCPISPEYDHYYRQSGNYSRKALRRCGASLSSNPPRTGHACLTAGPSPAGNVSARRPHNDPTGSRCSTPSSCWRARCGGRKRTCASERGTNCDSRAVRGNHDASPVNAARYSNGRDQLRMLSRVGPACPSRSHTYLDGITVPPAGNGTTNSTEG